MDSPVPAPPTDGPKSFSQLASKAGFWAPIIAILLNLSLTTVRQPEADRRVALVVGGLTALLLLAGLILSAAALVRICLGDRRAVLGRSLAGLAINGLLLALFIVGVSRGYARAKKTQELHRELRATVSNLRSNLNRSFNPKTGITNINASVFKEVDQQLSAASETLSGDDALFAQAMKKHLNRLQDGMRKFQMSVSRVAEAHVLESLDLTAREQLSERHAIMEQFLTANREFAGLLTNVSVAMEKDMVELQIPPGKIEKFMRAYHQRADRFNEITLNIRACDERVGRAALDALETLDANWGRWRFDRDSKRVIFQEATAADAYSSSIRAMDAAGREQVDWQKQLLTR